MRSLIAPPSSVSNNKCSLLLARLQPKQFAVGHPIQLKARWDRRKPWVAMFQMLWETELNLLSVGQFPKFSNNSNYFDFLKLIYSKCLSSITCLWENEAKAFFLRMENMEYLKFITGKIRCKF